MEGVADYNVESLHIKDCGSTSIDVGAGLFTWEGVVVGVHGWAVVKEGGVVREHVLCCSTVDAASPVCSVSTIPAVA